MTKRIIYYYQTFNGLQSILTQDTKVTHIHLSSIHFGADENNNPYIHLNNNKPTDKIFDSLWEDIKKAKQLLVQAGFPNGQGIPPLKIMVKNKTVSRQVGQFLALQVEKIGINLNVEAVTWATLLQNAQKGNYHIFYLAWFVGIPTANEFFELLYGPNHPKSYNRVGFKNKEFDSLFNKVKKIRNIKKQNDLIKRMNHIINNKLPLLPLVHAKTYYIQHGWLKNYIPIDQYGGLEQYYDIDLELKSKLINKL